MSKLIAPLLIAVCLSTGCASTSREPATHSLAYDVAKSSRLQCESGKVKSCAARSTRIANMQSLEDCACVPQDAMKRGFGWTR